METDFGKKEYFEELFSRSPYEDDPWGHNWRGRDKCRFDLHEKLLRRYTFNNEKRNSRIEILDIGCAIGDFTARLSKFSGNKNVTGIDISKIAIQKAKKRFPNINFKVSFLPETGLPENSFNLITCLEVLYYMNSMEIDASLHEIQRLLQNNGKVVFEVTIGKKPYFQPAEFIKLICEHFKIEKVEYFHARSYIKFENIFYHLYQKMNKIEKLLNLSDQEIRDWALNKNKVKIIRLVRSSFLRSIARKIIRRTKQIFRLAIKPKTPVKICHLISKKMEVNKSHIIILAKNAIKR